MKKLALIAFLYGFNIVLMQAQKAPKSIHQNLKASPYLVLNMPDGDGHNGAGVAYDSKHKQYVAVFAGNATFPLMVFDRNGEQISDDNLFALYDARGIWYNSKTKRLEGNAYGGTLVALQCDKQGIPTGTKLLHEPAAIEGYPYDPQQVAMLDAKHNRILYSWITEITTFNEKTQTEEVIVKAMCPIETEQMNATTAVYTGIKGAEIGLLNYVTKQVLLIDIATGKCSGRIQLPADAPCDITFNFAYANHLIWLFDIENRKWIGYAVD